MKYLYNSNFLKYQFCLLGIIFLFSCSREEINIIEEEEEIISSIRYFHDSHYTGRIYSSSGSIIPFPTISISENEFVGDINGGFFKANLKTETTGNLIKIAKPGFFDRFIYQTIDENAIFNGEIILEAKEDNFNFFNTSDNTLDVDQNIKINIPSNSIGDNNGNVYQGQISLCIQLESPEQPENYLFPSRVPVIYDGVKTSDILTNTTYFQFNFENANGEALEILNPIEIEFSNSSHENELFKLNQSYNAWEKIENTQWNGNDLKIFLNKTGVYSIGRVTESIEYSLTYKFEETSINTAFKLQLENNNTGVKEEFFLLQDGLWKGNLEKNTNYTATLKSNCSSTISKNNFSTENGTNSVISIPKQEAFVNLSYDLSYCPEMDFDINKILQLQIITDQKILHFWITDRTGNLKLPNCGNIRTVNLLQNEQLLYNSLIKQSDFFEPLQLRLKTMSVCPFELNGQMTIDKTTKSYKSDDFYILRENSNSDNLTITDMSNFIIEIKNVTTAGEYMVENFVFNELDDAFCQGEDCSEIKVNITSIGQQGDPVELNISGIVNGAKIKGFFNNELYR